MTSDELCARDLIKLDAAPDRKDYNDARGSKRTCSMAVPLSAEPARITLREKPLKVMTRSSLTYFVYTSIMVVLNMFLVRHMFRYKQYFLRFQI